MIKIVKRNGKVVDFNFLKIENAIAKAYISVYGKDLSETNKTTMNDICDSLKLYFRFAEKEKFTVEEVQDLVIMHIGYYDSVVAAEYAEYRDNKYYAKNELINSIMGIVNQTNKDVMTENANKKAQLIPTQRDLIAGEVSKYIAKTAMIPKYIMKEHFAGAIKVHDMDYFLHPIHNCELVNLKDMLDNGTVINEKMIETPKSLATAMTVTTQIIAQVASSTYGGQTITLSHLAPYVRVSENKIRNKFRSYNLPITEEHLESMVKNELQLEIRAAVQTFNYQISTIMSTNGQTPFVSVCMYINEDPEYKKETVMLIEEFLKQRIKSIKNRYGVYSTQTFPKLLYFLDENNTYEGSEYFWLTKLAAESTAKRMNPDYVSCKKMKEIIGHVFPPMGCRAFLSPFQDKDGNYIFYGRGNLGACTINLPYLALESGGDIDKFWELMDKYEEIVRAVGELRYNKLKNVKASIAPIIWQDGALARLDKDDPITKAIDEKGFTVTMGYSGIYETVKYLTGESHTTDVGFELAEKIMKHMKNACETFKKNQPHLRFALYGTPQESTTGWFSEKIRNKFGDIPDITDKGWITNSYHVDIREDIDAFSKLDLEAKLQNYSTGGAVSYVETYNMQKNVDAVIQLIQHIYETIIYAEINFESDVCGKCKYEGVMENDPDTLEWVCPNCGNRDQSTLSVVRRTCGYLGETEWTDGRKLDILNRVKHL